MDTVLYKILNLLWTNKISDIEFCNAIGINKSAVTDWKKGKTTSYNKHLTAIADYFNVDEQYFAANEITLDDFDYAMHEQARELSEADKAELLMRARHMNELRKLKE